MVNQSHLVYDDDVFMITPAVFKSYDIRGLSPGELDVVFARKLGKVLSAMYTPKHVVVGCDMRTTSPELEAGLIEGFLESGVTVTRIGLCSTPVFYSAVTAAGVYDLGVMVTASHNPSKYNGFKMVTGTNQPIGEGSGMERIKELMCSDVPVLSAPSRGRVLQDEGAVERYLERVFRYVALPEKLPAMICVVDTGNGMNGITMPSCTKRLQGVTTYPLYWDLDGRFPHHEANPLNTDTLKDLQTEVTKRQAVFGVAFDGDGDRVGFVDEQGAPIPGDILTALFARELLKDHPGAIVLYDVRSSWSVPELIHEAGGTPVMCRVGHAHIKRQMRETGALFGGELSMHFYFAELGYAEASDACMLLLIRILLREQRPLSMVWRSLVRYAHSGEQNFMVPQPKAMIERVAQAYAARATSISHIDGVRLEFRDPHAPENDWWMSVRASNTEPLLRLNVEARTEEALQIHLQELKHLCSASSIQE